MTKYVITVSPTDPLSHVAKILKEERISGMPVVDESDALVGVITLTDLLRLLHRIYRWKVLERHNSEPRFGVMFEDEKKNAKVSHVMTSRVLTVCAEDPIEKVVQIMMENKVHTIPVVDDGKLVGVVGNRDIICPEG